MVNIINKVDLRLQTNKQNITRYHLKLVRLGL